MLWLDLAKAFILVPAVLEHTEACFMWEWADNMYLGVFWLASGITSRPGFSIRRKAVALLVPYFIMSLLCLFFCWWYVGEPFAPRQIEGILYGRFVFWHAPVSASNMPLMNVENSVLWFLPSFFLASLVFRTLIRVKGIWRNVIAVTSCIAATAIMECLPVLLPWSMDTAPVFGAVIYMGRLIARSHLLVSAGWRVRVAVCVASAAIYFLFNRLTGATNVSAGNFGRSVFLWFPAAVSGALSFLLLCRFAGSSWISRVGHVVNSGALFIFGMQRPLFILAVDWYAPLHVESWKIRTLIVLIFSFAGGLALSAAYRAVMRLCGRRPGNPM